MGGPRASRRGLRPAPGFVDAADMGASSGEQLRHPPTLHVTGQWLRSQRQSQTKDDDTAPLAGITTSQRELKPRHICGAAWRAQQ
jgi:hypothetical protein